MAPVGSSSGCEAEHALEVVLSTHAKECPTGLQATQVSSWAAKEVWQQLAALGGPPVPATTIHTTNQLCSAVRQSRGAKQSDATLLSLNVLVVGLTHDDAVAAAQALGKWQSGSTLTMASAGVSSAACDHWQCASKSGIPGRSGTRGGAGDVLVTPQRAQGMLGAHYGHARRAEQQSRKQAPGGAAADATNIESSKVALVASVAGALTSLVLMLLSAVVSHRRRQHVGGCDDHWRVGPAAAAAKRSPIPMNFGDSSDYGGSVRVGVLESRRRSPANHRNYA